ncbi:hypothetical protein HDV05_001538, partial [Chytridiales sp. JEL 0842]
MPQFGDKVCKSANTNFTVYNAPNCQKEQSTASAKTENNSYGVCNGIRGVWVKIELNDT